MSLTYGQARPEQKAQAGRFASIVKALLGEPLVQFLALGAVLFGVYVFLERDQGGVASPTEIRLTLDDLAQLVIVFESQWRRAPTQDEFNAMVEDRIRGDILYREALALGLDKDDTIVKRRMAQKMQFLAEDVAAAREPSTEELREWFKQNQGMFSLPARLGFRHLYFSTDQRGNRAEADAAEALVRLAGQPEDSPLAAALADPFMFQDYYSDRTPQAIATEFGPEFAQAVSRTPRGSWQGPVRSGYGWHLVFVDTVIAGRVPAFEEVEQEVKVAWLGQAKAEAWEKAYDEMRARYSVYLPVPADDAVEAVSGTSTAPDAAPQ